MHLAMLSGVFAFSWSKWSASPTLGRWQFVMKAAEWADQGGVGTEQEVRGTCDSGREGYGPIEDWTLMIGHVVESANSVTLPQLPFLSLSPSLSLPLLLPPSLPPSWLPLPAACLVLDGWRRLELQVGFDRKGQGVLQ